MSSVHRALVGLLLVLPSGCHCFGPMVKRESELNCPTDIRKTVPWCAGEDAIFRCPCSPRPEFYGHKPTCWRVWPAPAAAWRDMYCGGLETAPSALPSIDEPGPRAPAEQPPLPPIKEATPPESLPPAPAVPETRAADTFKSAVLAAAQRSEGTTDRAGQPASVAENYPATPAAVETAVWNDDFNRPSSKSAGN
jgi:hypothetical protein